MKKKDMLDELDAFFLPRPSSRDLREEGRGRKNASSSSSISFFFMGSPSRRDGLNAIHYYYVIHSY